MLASEKVHPSGNPSSLNNIEVLEEKKVANRETQVTFHNYYIYKVWYVSVDINIAKFWGKVVLIRESEIYWKRAQSNIHFGV